MILILFRKDYLNIQIRPLYLKFRIVELKASFRLLAIEIVAFVRKERVVFQNDKAVRKTARNEQLTAVFSRKNYAYMFSVGKRTLADINGDIQYSSAYDSDKFSLRVGKSLPMKTSDDALGRKTFIILNELAGNTSVEISLFIVRLAKVASVITEKITFDYFHSLYLRIDNFHGFHSFCTEYRDVLNQTMFIRSHLPERHLKRVPALRTAT
jgi:hypothetical protein